MDSGPYKIAYVAGTPGANGAVVYSYAYTTASNVTVKVDLSSDATNNPTASLGGQVTVINNSAIARVLDIIVDAPVCQPLPGGTTFGGSVVCTLTTNADGGAVTCAPGATSVWQGTLNGVNAQGVYFCPFTMGSSGSGTMQSTVLFGTPIPSLSGPPALSMIGSRTRFTITPGEKLVLNSTVIAKSLGFPDPCPADLDGDGYVNANDLSGVISQWGQMGWCLAADLNGDGLVDGADMSVIFDQWGYCFD